MNGPSFDFCDLRNIIQSYGDHESVRFNSSYLNKKKRSQEYLSLILIFPLLILIHINVFAQSQMDYADFLMKEQDYFRAISVYKHIMYFSNDFETKNLCLLKIAKAYYKSNRFKASIKYLSTLQNQQQLPDSYFNRAQIYLGLNYYGLKVHTMAEDYFRKAVPTDTTGFCLYYLALLELEKENWRGASKSYEQVFQKFGLKEIGTLAKQLSEESLKGINISSKNPYLATFLSTILPGSGQLYCRHYFDAIQAFLSVGAFAFASYAAYRYDKNFNNNYLNTYIAISITSLFHIGNIIGAQRTASYYNLKQRQRFLERIREKAFSIEY